jgi:predicted kinase
MPGHLIIMRGYSGSGKSTEARRLVRDSGNAIRVSRDDIRAMLTGSDTKTVLDPDGETLVTKIEEKAVRDALRRNLHVVVDDTNLRLKFARRWADIAVQEGAGWRVWDVTTDHETCVHRNAYRADGWLNSTVIDDQARRFPMPWPEVTPSVQKEVFKPYVPDTSLPTAFGFDLDGTLALNLSGRSWYDPSRYCDDTVNETLRLIIDSLARDNQRILLFTGRSEDHRYEVERWLRKNYVAYDELIMRKSGDNRDDAIVKSELFDEFVAPRYNFLCQFDDRDRVVDALRSKGITVYQVNYGAF